MSVTISPQSPVLVTGASGYIAGWIVHFLLQAGRTVHATVRDPNKSSSVQHLLESAKQSPGTLKLFKADLLTEGSFDEAMQGCELVMHTASPFVLDGFTDAEAALVKPAVDGTKNVLASANRCASVRRVVLTSSVAAIYGDNADVQGLPNSCIDESLWNTTSSLTHNPYQYSKMAAEKAAWEIHKTQQQWDLVTINPSLVLGPALAKNSQSASIGTLKQMADGSLAFGVPHLVFGVVDVRDVAHAHILAGDTPSARGRYLLCAQTLSLLQIGQCLRADFGQYPLPKFELPKLVVWLFGPLLGPVTRPFISRNVGYDISFNNQRSLSLGLHYRTTKTTIVEHFQQLIDDGLIRKRG